MKVESHAPDSKTQRDKSVCHRVFFFVCLFAEQPALMTNPCCPVQKPSHVITKPLYLECPHTSRVMLGLWMENSTRTSIQTLKITTASPSNHRLPHNNRAYVLRARTYLRPQVLPQSTSFRPYVYLLLEHCARCGCVFPSSDLDTRLTGRRPAPCRACQDSELFYSSESPDCSFTHSRR